MKLQYLDLIVLHIYMYRCMLARYKVNILFNKYKCKTFSLKVLPFTSVLRLFWQFSFVSVSN